MSRTPSTMLELGTEAPDFNLPDPTGGGSVSLSDFRGKPLLIVFSCNHCPYVLHLLRSFAEYAREARKSGLSVVMINANDIDNYPADSPQKMIELVGEYKLEFPYLYKELDNQECQRERFPVQQRGAAKSQKPASQRRKAERHEHCGQRGAKDSDKACNIATKRSYIADPEKH